jgi:hypothetical protein
MPVSVFSYVHHWIVLFCIFALSHSSESSLSSVHVFMSEIIMKSSKVWEKINHVFYPVLYIVHDVTGTRLMDIFFYIILRVFPIYCPFSLNHYHVYSQCAIYYPHPYTKISYENLGANDNDLIKTDSK